MSLLSVSDVRDALSHGALSEHEMSIVSMLQVRTQVKEIKQRVQSDTAPKVEKALGCGLPDAKHILFLLLRCLYCLLTSF